MSMELAQEFVGRRVKILFVSEEGSESFYPGSITAVREESSKYGGVKVEHCIEFDDGDADWFVLQEQEEKGRLQWPKKRASAVASISRPQRKKQKTSKATNVMSPDGKEGKKHVDVPDPPPKTIDDIIRFMDKLEPNKHYFKKQQDSREGCSKTRKKLRDFAKKNPEHPAVQHYVQNKSWQPPDDESLFALVDLIKTMIK